MKYDNIEMIWDNINRFLLKKQWKNILIVVWINPSIADNKVADTTMKKVMWFAELNWYDWFAMINVIPQRSTNPKNINSSLNNKLKEKNLNIINDLLSKIDKPNILLAFWNTIDEKKYFIHSLKDIIKITDKYNSKYLAIWLTKDWNPLHPSRAWYCKFIEFNVNDYINKK